MPSVSVDEESARYLRLGNPVNATGLPTEGFVQVYVERQDDEDEFIGVGIVDDNGMVAPKRITVVQEA